MTEEDTSRFFIGLVGTLYTSKFDSDYYFELRSSVIVRYQSATGS